MTASAAIKFTQGATTDLAGRALVGMLSGGAVTVSNGVDTSVTSWKYELLYVPPGSGLSLVTQGPGATSTFNFTPDVAGSYRVRLTVSDGALSDVDIRNFSVPCLNGTILPPYQVNPSQLPITGVGAKADEMNFGGQSFGWVGDSDISRQLVNQSLKTVDALKGALIQNVQTFGATGDGSTDDTSAVQAALNAMTTGGVLYFPRGTYVISSTLTMNAAFLWITGEGTNANTNAGSANPSGTLASFTGPITRLCWRGSVSAPMLRVVSNGGVFNIEFQGSSTLGNNAISAIDVLNNASAVGASSGFRCEDVTIGGCLNGIRVAVTDPLSAPIDRGIIANTTIRLTAASTGAGILFADSTNTPTAWDISHLYVLGTCAVGAARLTAGIRASGRCSFTLRNSVFTLLHTMIDLALDTASVSDVVAEENNCTELNSLVRSVDSSHGRSIRIKGGCFSVSSTSEANPSFDNIVLQLWGPGPYEVEGITFTALSGTHPTNWYASLGSAINTICSVFVHGCILPNNNFFTAYGKLGLTALGNQYLSGGVYAPYQTLGVLRAGTYVVNVVDSVPPVILDALTMNNAKNIVILGALTGPLNLQWVTLDGYEFNIVNLTTGNQLITIAGSTTDLATVTLPLYDGTHALVTSVVYLASYRKFVTTVSGAAGVPSGTAVGQAMYWTGSVWANTSAPSTNQYLQYNGANVTWTTITGAGVSVPAGTGTGQMLYWNGSAWVDTSSPSNGAYLQYSGGTFSWLSSNSITNGNGQPGGTLLYNNGAGSWITSPQSQGAGSILYTDGTYFPHWSQAPGTSQILYWNGSAWVATTSAGANQYLQYNGTTFTWASALSMSVGTGVGQVLYWNSLAWVDTSNPSAGQYLQYNGTSVTWSSITSVPAGTGAGQVLYWNGASWVDTGTPPGHGAMLYFDVSGAVKWTTTPTNGQSLKYSNPGGTYYPVWV